MSLKKSKMGEKKAVLWGQMPQTETDTVNAQIGKSAHNKLGKASEFAVTI